MHLIIFMKANKFDIISSSFIIITLIMRYISYLLYFLSESDEIAVSKMYIPL